MLPEPSNIPADLMARLTSLKDVLSANGAVIARKEPDHRPGWRVRYWRKPEDGRRHHYSISLPDDRTAMAVRALIADWQQQHRQWRQERLAIRKTDELAKKKERRKQRERRRLVLALAGGGRRRRKRIGQLYDQAVARGWEALLRFHFLEQYKQPNRRPGRPRKGRLALWSAA